MPWSWRNAWWTPGWPSNTRPEALPAAVPGVTSGLEAISPARPASMAALFFGAVALHTPPPAAAWGTEGHEVVALVAQARLSPAARRGVEELLAVEPGGHAGVDLDLGRPRSPAHGTASWHYVNLPREAGCRYVAARDCADAAVRDRCARGASRPPGFAGPAARAFRGAEIRGAPGRRPAPAVARRGRRRPRREYLSGAGVRPWQQPCMPCGIRSSFEDWSRMRNALLRHWVPRTPRSGPAVALGADPRSGTQCGPRGGAVGGRKLPPRGGSGLLPGPTCVVHLRRHLRAGVARPFAGCRCAARPNPGTGLRQAPS